MGISVPILQMRKLRTKWSSNLLKATQVLNSEGEVHAEGHAPGSRPGTPRLRFL